MVTMKYPRLKKIIGWLSLGSIAVLILLTMYLPAIALTPKHYTELELPPLPEVQLPEYERYQLANGMTVYLVEDRDLPLIGGTAIIRTGNRYEPANKVGLAGLTGELMRGGGTQNHPADELNLILEQKAASIETAIDTTAGSASFSTLTEDLDTILPLFAEVLRQPAFAPTKFTLALNQQKGSIERRNDDPQEIANREFARLIYGDTSPYGRITEYETLNNITREDVISFYQKYVHPDNIILGIAGDFNTEDMKSRIDRVFSDWQAASSPLTLDAPSAKQKNLQGIFAIDRPQATQSNVLLGHLGGRFDSPDYPALSVLNGLLNGFGGRLFNEVRSRQGLAYSVYGYWSPRYDYDGTFTAGGQTRTETTVPFIQAIMEQIAKLRTTPVSETELSQAKESILNSFVFNFQNPSQTLSRLMNYEYYGYPEDFIFRYQEGVRKTTVEDIQRIAQEYLQPDKIITLVVGNSQKMSPPLNSITKDVKTVDITIPKPPQS
jgi:zinc protease